MFVLNVVEAFNDSATPEWLTDSQQLIKDDAQAPDVGAAIHSMYVATHLLGGHISGRSDDLPCQCLLAVFGNSKAEVSNLQQEGGVD